MAINAGMASSICFQVIFTVRRNINTPTNTNAGAVAIDAIIDSIGSRKRKGSNTNAATVARPASIPTADSM